RRGGEGGRVRGVGTGIHRAARGDQRSVGAARRGVRGGGSTRPLGGRGRGAAARGARGGRARRGAGVTGMTTTADPATTERADAACHDLLVRLAGRLPDRLLWRLREWL